MDGWIILTATVYLQSRLGPGCCFLSGPGPGPDPDIFSALVPVPIACLCFHDYIIDSEQSFMLKINQRTTGERFFEENFLYLLVYTIEFCRV
jgi:hypothetical protein